MQVSLKVSKVDVMPNGVNLQRFKPIVKEISLREIEWEESKKHILFAANPNVIAKNYILARTAIKLLDNSIVQLHYLDNITYDKMPYYFNAADVVLLTSLWEGSPNVIKEAMACNCPIVSTDVGDVKEIFGNTEGCYITSYKAEEVAKKIRFALEFPRRTSGYKRIIELGLDSTHVADRIIESYKSILNV